MFIFAICLYFLQFIICNESLVRTKSFYKMLKIILILAFFVMSESVLYSSFWAPLFNPRILNYRVDINYDPDGGKNAQNEYVRKYGYRGEQLIEDLGNRKHPRNTDEKKYGDVKFYYTYLGAENEEHR